MTEKTKAPGSELFDQALKNYEQALRAGLKIQEEAGKYWTKLFNQAASPHDLQKQLTSMATDVIPTMQKSMAACLELIEHNSRTSIELMKKGLETVQTTNAAETQGKLAEFCDASLKSLKANVQAIVDINTRAVDSWISLTKKATTEVGEQFKAARA